MKKSKFNYIKSYKHNHLIFNALYNTSVILDHKTYKDFKANRLSLSDEKELERLGILTEKNFNEIDASLFASRKIAETENLFFYRIYTTMACNAKCPYCYEKGIKAVTMDTSCADKVISFIESNMKYNMKLVLEWFGGEPLLNAKIISYICNKVSLICKKYNASFVSNIVTNGYLFDEQLITESKNWNLNKAQITLDGTKHYYESIKQFNKPNAFEKVINNIEMLSNNGVKVAIRLNYDKNNLSEILNLIKFLGEKFSNDGNIVVYARKIMYENKNNSFKKSQNLDILIYKALIDANLVHKDFIINAIPRRPNMCIAHMLNAYIISPEGLLGKCSQALFSDSVGDIDNGVNEKKLVKWCSTRLEKKCLKCKLLPICNGGCLYEKMKNKEYCYYSNKFLNFQLKTFLEDYVNNQ